MLNLHTAEAPLFIRGMAEQEKPCLKRATSCRDAKMIVMEKTVRVFDSFEEADQADTEYYRSLSPAQRVEILLILRDQYSPYDDEVTQGFERVCRIIKHS